MHVYLSSLFLVKFDPAHARRQRGWTYRNVLTTLKNRTVVLADRTKTEVATIHLMSTPECGIKSSVTFGSEDSTLERLWKHNSLGKGNY